MRELAPELRAVRGIARAAQAAGQVDDLLRELCATVAESFSFERASIAQYRPETDDTVALASVGVPDHPLLAEPRQLDDVPLFRRALDRGESIYVEDATKDRALPRELVEAFGVRSVLTVPLMSGGRCLGFLSADRSGKPFRLSDDQLEALTTIGTVAAVFLEKALVEENLRRLDDLKSNFIALASHELRTPAAVVHGIASTLFLRGSQLTDDQLRQLRATLYEQTDRLRKLVDQLLDLSRLEADGIRILPEPLPVRRCVQELLLSAAGDRADEIALDIPPDLEAYADANAFERIVSNLLTNALRYGSPPVTISAEQPDRYFRLTVEDRGRGVPAEFVPQLFERFTRSGQSSEPAIGAGLGLAIAQSYANAHGGEILYEDASPQGARFQLVLPRGANR